MIWIGLDVHNWRLRSALANEAAVMVLSGP